MIQRVPAVGEPHGFAMALKGGERKAYRDQALLEALSDLVVDVPLTVRSVVWHKRKQKKASSVRYIAVATTFSGAKWVARIVQGTEQGVRFTELRSFHPQETRCKQTRIDTNQVPPEVVDALKMVILEARGSARRIAVLRMGQD